MADPTLTDALAAGVLGVALFCAGRLVLGAAWRRPVERDVDLTHLVMGVSMAGMLTGWLSGRWTTVWIVAFTASAVWFAWRTRRELRRATGASRGGRLGAGGHLPHVVASVAMLYMLVAMRWLPADSGGHAMAGMSGMASTAIGSGTPALALAVAALLVLDGVVSAGRALLRPVAVPAVVPAGGGAVMSAAPTHLGAVLPLAPRGTAACTLVMSLAMGYMFVTMHP